MNQVETQTENEKAPAAPQAVEGQSVPAPQDAPFLNSQGYVDWAPGDPGFPQNWPMMRRVWITACVVFLVFNATFASSAISGCFPSLMKSFHISSVLAGLSVTLFLLGYCAGPLFFAPLSEVYGRRWIFYITFTLYFVFNFLCAYAPNYAALLIGRAITGTLVSAPLSNAPGVIADVWNPIERGTAMAGFAASVWCGSALGPVVGGFLQLKKDWRWVFLVQIWLAAFSLIFMVFIPETHAPTLLRQRAKRLRQSGNPEYANAKAPADDADRSLGPVLKVATTRPWIILFDPISFFCALYLSVIYTLLYMLFGIYPFIFQRKRGWNAGVSKLPLLGTIVGCFVGAGVIVMETQKRAKRIRRGEVKQEDFQAEDRLPLAMVGGVGFAISMFAFAWTGEFNSIPWIVPTIFGGILSCCLLLVFVAFLNYIVDVYLQYAASAIAANTIARSACGSAAPLFTLKMFQALGVGVGGSVIGAVAVALSVIPFLFYKYGAGIRARSKFSPAKGAKPGQDEELAVMTAYEAYAKSMEGLVDADGRPIHFDDPWREDRFSGEWPLRE
ncbi:hypothetical protein L249_1376 [Ophiocordyceps polyrhachis-furcata BCC 54312]|uniref:Major facilitator superfamily (MFS) profile domain-containing protein n=1 Tax=Ophiocordyceps polyrhachis-furcata BCC 54312 TaxID=1330021 RepID=A0A367KYZ1_9HYPO|nr:hypothetical protein L249_1376 [Ophiocordyceps polyrhachis-furcata BCC 54312]